MPVLSLTRLNITRAEVGILRVMASATVTVYDTMTDGSAAVDESGTVQAGAVKSTLYADRGGVSTKSNPLIADTQGLIQFYSPRKEVHIQIVALDGTKYGMPWQSVGGFPSLEVGDGHVDLRDYLTLTDAMAALGSDRGIVHCPSGTYHKDSLKGAIKKNTVIPANVSLKGVGFRGALTRFLLNDSDPNADYFTCPPISSGKFEGIYFRGIRDEIGAGTGRVFIIDGCNALKFANCIVDQACGIGLETVFTSGADNVNLWFEDSAFFGTGSHAMKLVTNTFGTVLINTNLTSKNGHCLWNKSQNFVMYSGSIEPNDDTIAAVNMDGARQFGFHGTWIEYNPAYAVGANPPTAWFIELNNAPANGSYGGSIRNCRFVRTGATQSLRAVKSNGNYSWVMDNNIGILGNGVTITGTDDVQTNAGDRVTFLTQHKRMRDDMSSVSNWTIAGAGTSAIIGL